jgi:hypothetical protein
MAGFIMATSLDAATVPAITTSYGSESVTAGRQLYGILQPYELACDMAAWVDRSSYHHTITQPIHHHKGFHTDLRLCKP